MNNELLSKPIAPLYRKYLIPTLISMLSNSLYCLVDVYFISQGSGSLGLAALNIAMPIYTMYSCIGLLFGVGASTIMAIAEGARDPMTRNRAFSMCVGMMAILGAAFTVIGLVWIEPFAYLLGSSEELLPYVLEYMVPIQCTSMIFIFMYASSLLLRADHNPRLAMIAMLVGNISNMILDYVFVMVFHMGIEGAAIATAISPCITVTIASLHFRSSKRSIKLVSHWYSFDLLKRMIANGLGSGVMELSAGLVILIFNSVILSISHAQMLAAYAIITNIAYVCKGLLNGFAQAAQPLISTNHGAGIQERVRGSLACCVRYAFVFSISLYLIFLLFPRLIAMPFSSGDEALIDLAEEGIRFYFSSLPCLALNTMIMYYFQAVEQGKLSTILALCKGVIFVLLGLLLLVPFFYMRGVWLTMTFAEGLCFLVGGYIYKKQQ